MRRRALSAEEFIRLSHERGRIILEATDRMSGTMAAIETDADTVASYSRNQGRDGRQPQQPKSDGNFRHGEGYSDRPRTLSATGHSRSTYPGRLRFPFASGRRRQRAIRSRSRFVLFQSPQYPVYANTTAEPYPGAPACLVDVLARHLVSPVRFRDEIESMYAAGARIFIEVGPQGVLTGLVGQTLAGRPHLAIASDLKGRPGLVQLQHLLGQLLVEGVSVQLERLYEGRNLRRLDLANLERDSAPAKLSPSTWLVNSVRVRPLHGPEPKLLGQARPTDRAGPAPARTILDKPKVIPSANHETDHYTTIRTRISTNGATHTNGVHPPPAPRRRSSPSLPVQR